MGLHDFVVEGRWRVAVSCDDAEYRQTFGSSGLRKPPKFRLSAGVENDVELGRAQRCSQVAVAGIVSEPS